MSKDAPTVHEVFVAATTSDEERHALECRFFDRVALTNGTYKTTYSNRLNDIDEAFLPYIARLPARPVQIMDIGASSGITTAEWHTCLTRAGLDCDITGSDLLVHASYLTFRHTSKIAALVDSNGRIVHFDFFGRGYPRQPARNPLRPNALRTLAVSAVVRAAMFIDRKRRLKRQQCANTGGSKLVDYTAVSLISRRFVSNSRLRMVEEDFFADPAADKSPAFNVIRAANILNLAYFSAERLKRMLVVIRHRLHEGGLLIVARTERSGKNDASLFRRHDGGLVLVDRFGGGSEIEALVRGLN